MYVLLLPVRKGRVLPSSSNLSHGVASLEVQRSALSAENVMRFSAECGAEAGNQLLSLSLSLSLSQFYY